MKAQLILLCSLPILFGCFKKANKVEEPLPGCGVRCGNERQEQMPTVFKAKCAVCHSLDKDMTGPKLRNILDRVPSEEWFDAFVQYEDSLVNANDPYTIEVQKWSPVRGNHNSELKDEELKELKDYLSQKKSQQ